MTCIKQTAWDVCLCILQYSHTLSHSNIASELWYHNYIRALNESTIIMDEVLLLISCQIMTQPQLSKRNLIPYWNRSNWSVALQKVSIKIQFSYYKKIIPIILDNDQCAMHTCRKVVLSKKKLSEYSLYLSLRLLLGEWPQWSLLLEWISIEPDEIPLVE